MKRIVLLIIINLVVISDLHADHPVLIVNHDVTKKKLTRNGVRAMFVMRLLEWPDGRPVKVFVLGDNHSLHVSFSKRFLGIFPYQLRRAWDRLVFSGTGQVPRRVETVQEMRKLVATTPGSIGYLWKDKLDGSVRSLKID